MENKVIYSNELEQNIMIGCFTGAVKTEDGVYYSSDELDILKNIGGISKKIHMFKRVFDGSQLITRSVK